MPADRHSVTVEDAASTCRWSLSSFDPDRLRPDFTFNANPSNFGENSNESSPQDKKAAAKPANCLSNINAETWAGLGLDAVGVAASLTGLKAAWTAGSTITGMVAGMSSMYLSAATGDGGGLGRAGFGAALTHAGSFDGASRLATNLPVVGAAAAVGVTGYDVYQALKKAGCFK